MIHSESKKTLLNVLLGSRRVVVLNHAYTIDDQ